MAGENDENNEEQLPILPDRQPSAASSFGWFAPSPAGQGYPPQAGNVIQPLINGERAFRAVHSAITGAKKSIDILMWGFSPSMRLVRPSGERIGEILRRKAVGGVTVRLLVWTAPFNVMGTVPGGGMAGSGGSGVGTGSGSGGSAGSGNSNGSSGSSGSGSGDENETDNTDVNPHDNLSDIEYNRLWFANPGPSISYGTLGFSTTQRIARDFYHAGQGRSLAQNTAMSYAPSYHQKLVIVDYAQPDDAVGFVMGHNMLPDYWDTNGHHYHMAGRTGSPWQDLSCRVYGPVLNDLYSNYNDALEWADGSTEGLTPGPSRRPEEFVASAQRRGRSHSAQVCRTDFDGSDFSIKNLYKNAMNNARDYLYMENQYFRYTELVDALKESRKKLKAAGHTRELYIFVVTNVPGYDGRKATYAMLDSLGKGELMPRQQQISGGGESSSNDNPMPTPSDLADLKVHICSLVSSGADANQPGGVGYKDIYVHSKLLIVDDVFFTLGSANINVRSMESDPELNVASPAPQTAKKFREDLWGLHTSETASDDMEAEFIDWRRIMDENAELKQASKQLSASLVEFFDGGGARMGLD